MSEFGGLRKHKNNPHAPVPPKTECGCPSGGGIKNGHICYPSYGGTQRVKKRKKEIPTTPLALSLDTMHCPGNHIPYGRSRAKVTETAFSFTFIPASCLLFTSMFGFCIITDRNKTSRSDCDYFFCRMKVCKLARTCVNFQSFESRLGFFSVVNIIKT